MLDAVTGTHLALEDTLATVPAHVSETGVGAEGGFVQAVIAGEHQVGTLGELRAFLKEIFARAHGENGKTDQYVSDKSFHILFHLSG